MKIVIFGPRGYLGSQFLRLYLDAYAADVDIADKNAVAEVLDAEKPDVVINTAGRTGRPNIDWCEDHKEQTVLSNVMGPLALLEECGKRDIYWVHIGSGCIYQGDNGGTGFTEEDEPNFLGSFYSKTKVWSDQILQHFPVLNIRLRMPFEGTDHPRNLITKLTKYDRILDVQNSLTYLPDFFDAVQALIDKKQTGTFNIVNPGSASPYEIMQLYKDIVDPAFNFTKLEEKDLSEVAKAGRSNCLLNTDKLERHGISLRPVDAAVKDAMERIAVMRKGKGSVLESKKKNVVRK